jgi:hypothetical protein
MAAMAKPPSSPVTEANKANIHVQKIKSVLRPNAQLCSKTIVSNMNIRGLPMHASIYSNKKQEKMPPSTKVEWIGSSRANAHSKLAQCTCTCLILAGFLSCVLQLKRPIDLTDA